jgi:hypothetical protein
MPPERRPGREAGDDRGELAGADLPRHPRLPQSVPPMMPNHHLTQDEMFALAAYIMSLREE